MPKSCFAFESSTYNVFLFFRTVMAKGDGAPDPKSAVELAETTRIYPLSFVRQSPKTLALSV